MAAEAGGAFHYERRRRQLTLRELAARARLSPATIHALECGEIGSLDAYSRVSVALGLRPELRMVDPRRRDGARSRDEDPVHAAIVEALATRYAAVGYETFVDEPFQHYRFGGRADLVAVHRAGRALLHHEIKGDLPNVGETAGSWNSKRAYLASCLADRLGMAGWSAVTHVLTFAWTAEVLHVLRIRATTFRALAPDSADSFAAWWTGRPPTSGRSSTMILWDPLDRPRAARWVGPEGFATARPRHRDYAGVAIALRDVERG